MSQKVAITMLTFGDLSNGPEELAEDESGFESGTEITFNCIASMAGERTTWKIICEDGTWVGRSQICGKWSHCSMDSNIIQYLFVSTSQ